MKEFWGAKDMEREEFGVTVGAELDYFELLMCRLVQQKTPFNKTKGGVGEVAGTSRSATKYGTYGDGRSQSPLLL